MKNYYFTFCLLIGSFLFFSCTNEFTEKQIEANTSLGLMKFENKITIDSAYTYQGDSLYMLWLKEYNDASPTKTRSLSPEDDAFFNKKHIVKSTEASILYGKTYLYPGAIFEGNSISDQKYAPIFLQNRNPITISMTLNHNTPKQTSRTIQNPSKSQLEDYVKEMVVDGNFQQNEKFMFQQNRFTFYDEIKSAFGTNVDTRKLFSSRKESSTEYKEKIMKSSGMFVKFYQSCFTVNMDIAPLSNQPIKGNTTFEPVYVSSITYGRMGILVFETDSTYEFAEKCMNKEFSRIFKRGKETLTEEELRFFERTEFKILILGGDSDYTVQTVKGYSQFLNLIYHSTFTQTSYGVPISCSFSYANSHGLVETEFVNTLYIEPLFVKVTQENSHYSRDYSGENYRSSSQIYLNFYKNREKTQESTPYIDIVFNIDYRESSCRLFPDYNQWPMIDMECKDKYEKIKLRNIGFKSKILVGTELSYYESDGPTPGGKPHEPMYAWRADEFRSHYSLEPSPFYKIIY